MYLKPHQHHNLARNQCTCRNSIDDISLRQYSTRGPQGEKEFLAGPFSDAAFASIAGFTPKQLVCLLDGLTLAGDFGLSMQMFQTDLSRDTDMMQTCRKLIV